MMESKLTFNQRILHVPALKPKRYFFWVWSVGIESVQTLLNVIYLMKNYIKVNLTMVFKLSFCFLPSGR